MEIFFFAGATQAFLLAFLISQQKTKLPDRFLCVWMILLGFHLLGAYLGGSGFYRQHPQWFGLDAALPLIHGPCVYVFALLATGRLKKFVLVNLLHLAPYLFFTCALLYRTHSYVGKDPYAFISQMFNDESDLLIVLFGLFMHLHNRSEQKLMIPHCERPRFLLVCEKESRPIKIFYFCNAIHL